MKINVRTSSKALVLTLLFALLPSVGNQAIAVLSCAGGGTCNYGDTGPGGGKVFITPSTAGNSTGKYFELAPASTEAITPWCGNGAGAHNTSTLIGTSTGIGTGKTNTDAIVAFCGGASAADSATAYRGGGFSDWFLPSKDELNAVYWNLKVGGLDTFNAGDVYTSSSESTTTTVWMQDINENYGPRASSSYFQRNFTKTAGSWYPIYNRPVRMFNPGDVANSGGGSSDNSSDEARRQHEEKVRLAKVTLIDLVKKKAEVKNPNLTDCEYSPLTADLLARANKDFLALTSITEARINAVVTKYELIAKLEAPVITAVYPRSLVAYEVIPAATPAKGLLLSELKRLDPSLRDTPEKIAVIVEQHTKAVNEQKQRLAKLLNR